MILQPAVLALLIGSFLTTLMIVYSDWYAVTILRRWDIRSGSETQLELERRTYLISTFVAYALGFQLISLFLFIYTADSIHTLLVGAMCAAGSLYANNWGYPTILLKTLNFLLAGLWLILNHADNKGYDYPLIRKKYILLLAISPLVIAEAVLQTSYFLAIHPDIITSCCGTLFTNEDPESTSVVLGLSRAVLEPAFYAIIVAVIGLGLLFKVSGRGAWVLAITSQIAFVIALAGFITFISIYIYEQPTHHCPFCVLQKEYGFIGYPLYLCLLLGTLSGGGVGLLQPFRFIQSLGETIPTFQKRLAVVCAGCYFLFLGMAVTAVMLSNLRVS